jgi:hypothetical protein
MGTIVRCSDGIVLEVISCPGREFILEERDAATQAPLTTLTSAEVMSLYRGAVIDRAHAVADLTREQFRVVFGDSNDPRYKLGQLLRAIGRRIRDPDVIACLRELRAPLKEVFLASRQRGARAQKVTAMHAVHLKRLRGLPAPLIAPLGAPEREPTPA